jgi:hypothetical protein
MSVGKLRKAVFGLTMVDRNPTPNTGLNLFEAVVDPEHRRIPGSHQVFEKEPSTTSDVENAIAWSNPCGDNLEISFSFDVLALHEFRQ